uniref:AMP_N domain-containing protein n=1 Tax=Onchocerca volvulus TaxID=6282 RepID=A0A8R1XPA0_ONCVO
MIGGICRCLRRVSSSSSIATVTAMKQGISAAEYTQRRSDLIAKLRHAMPEIENKSLVVVLRSAIRHFYAPDVPYPFHQCSYFRYFTGLNQPDAVLIIAAESEQKPKSILYIEERSEKQELWEGPGLTANEIANISGLDEIKERNQLILDLQTSIFNTVGCTVSYDTTTLQTIRDGLSEVLSTCDTFVPVREHIDALRWIKSSAEQDLMRQTCSIGAHSMNAVIAKSRGVSNENEIIGQLELEVRRRGAASLAYPPVVAAGNRANIIHYLDANKAINDSDTILVDAGCEYEGYSSDITRVFPVSGHFSVPQRAIYDALNDVQSRLLDYLRQTESLRLNEIYLTMIEYIARNCSEIGMFSSNIGEEELLHEADKLCPHHVSHYLGMDIHDTASVARNIPLQAGVTFTIEPGDLVMDFDVRWSIYVRHDNEKVRKEFRGIGMRIEDDILLGSNGEIEVLTKDAVRDPESIKLLMMTERVGQSNDDFCILQNVSQ